MPSEQKACAEAICKFCDSVRSRRNSAFVRARDEHWVREKISGPMRIEHLAERVLWRGKSAYQEILLAENSDLGKFLLLDGDIQSSTSDFSIYHELLVHPGLLVHPRPQRILILGGGEGATLREVLRHDCVSEVVLVEQDATLVKVCREFAPEFHGGAFHDPRCHLIVGDAIHYLENAKGHFDVILADLTETGRGGAKTLDFKELYRLISVRLGLDGIFCTQAGSGGRGHEGAFLRHYRMLGKHWSRLCPMVELIPCYHNLWCFLTASNVLLPTLLTEDSVDQHLIHRGITSLQAYDGTTHLRVGHLPKHLRKALAHIHSGSG